MPSGRHRSVVAQTLHYLSRPHASVLRAPLHGPAAWRSSDFAEEGQWQEQLDAAEIAEIDVAQRTAVATGKALGDLVATDFPLPSLSGRIAGWRRTLSVDGRGFVLVRGLPVARWSELESERFFWCLGLHLGVPGAQSGEGELLGHVRDRGHGRDDTDVRAYRTSAEIAFHCDAADVVGLLCLSNAATGGRSRIVSSVAVMNELLARAPHLVERLYEPFAMDTRGDAGLDWIPVVPCRHSGGRLRTFYHADYFRTAARHAGAPPLGERERALLDAFDAIASDPSLRLEMDLAPGDLQLVSNHTIVHGRGGYDDPPDAARRRHLLRLWLSLEPELGVGDRLRVERERLRIVATLARAKLRARIAARRRV